MVINMNETRLTTIAQIEEFLSGSGQIEFTPSGGDLERYAHISRVLKRFDYPRLGKRDKGMVLRYLRHTSGYSRQQLTRLVERWHANRLAATPLAKRYSAPAAPFARKYTSADVALLAQMDRAHEDVCGPAIAHLLQRAFHVYADARYVPPGRPVCLAPLQRAKKCGLSSPAGQFYQDPSGVQPHWCAPRTTPGWACRLRAN